jgi:hypothetical protein
MTWLHYVCLYTKGRNQKTTSPKESMHWTMKSGIAAVDPTQSMATASVNMMTKSEYKDIQ